MSKENLTELSKEHNKKSNWLKEALYRKNNRKWLGYSSEIARRVLAVIKDDDSLTQTKLASILGVKDQQVSKIIKGKENLTLQSIANLSSALGVELITFPEYKYSQSLAGTLEMPGKKEDIHLMVYYDIEGPINNPFPGIMPIAPERTVTSAFIKFESVEFENVK